MGQPEFPVLSNEAQDALDITPYNGSPLPGKCVVSPEMELLECNHGHGSASWAGDVILDHLAR